MTTPNKTPPGADPKQLERTGKDGKLGHKLFGHSHLVNQDLEWISYEMTI